MNRSLQKSSEKKALQKLINNVTPYDRPYERSQYICFNTRHFRTFTSAPFLASTENIDC